MRVNSAFKGFFKNRLVVCAGIAIVMLFCISEASGRCYPGTRGREAKIPLGFKPSERDLRVKQANIIIREIGHRLLLQAGDSTSLVLPVTEIKEGTFLLTFENQFVFFNHDSLIMLTQGLFSKTQFPSGYTVTVHDCMNSSIVYGFQINNSSSDVLACRGRSQPEGCYSIEIALPDLYETEEPNTADIDHPTEERKSFKTDPRETNPKLAELKAVNVDTKEASPKAEELNSFKLDPPEADPELEELKTTTFDHPLINLVYSGMLVLLSVALLIGRYGKSLVPVAMRNQNHAIVVERVVPEGIALGRFIFDVKDQRLLLGGEVISLTDKECRILELLNENFGELIPRETLMQKIWISEGVITGRSLDMFISKLRKKLSGDPELRITNVHGKGYRLEIPGIQNL
jgi:DNA-binding winged helix-turn-helix (wHTH) protein